MEYLTFQASDGDNFSSDNEKFIELARELKDICQLYGYCEIEPERHYNQDKLHTTLQPLVGPKLKTVRVVEKSDVWPAFRTLMGGTGMSLTKG